jgi:hypothetical protein
MYAEYSERIHVLLSAHIILYAIKQALIGLKELKSKNIPLQWNEIRSQQWRNLGNLQICES